MGRGKAVKQLAGSVKLLEEYYALVHGDRWPQLRALRHPGLLCAVANGALCTRGAA